MFPITPQIDGVALRLSPVLEAKLAALLDHSTNAVQIIAWSVAALCAVAIVAILRRS